MYIIYHLFGACSRVPRPPGRFLQCTAHGEAMDAGRPELLPVCRRRFSGRIARPAVNNVVGGGERTAYPTSAASREENGKVQRRRRWRWRSRASVPYSDIIIYYYLRSRARVFAKSVTTIAAKTMATDDDHGKTDYDHGRGTNTSDVLVNAAIIIR